MTVRVVSLVPSATETLVAWGLTPVAVTRFCEQPDLMTVGGTKNPDITAIVALAPDLVVVDREENRREDADALAAAGVAIHVTHVRRVADVAPMLADLRRAVGLGPEADGPRAGETWAGETWAGETGAGDETGAGETGAGDTGAGDETGAGETGAGDTWTGGPGAGETGAGETGTGEPDRGGDGGGAGGVVAGAGDGRPVAAGRLRVWVPIWRRPWMTVNDDTYGGSVLEACGLVNIFGGHPDRYPSVSLDEVAARRPDVILAPTEPYAFKERHRVLFADIAPMTIVDGQDLFWWGVRTRPALDRLRRQIADLRP